MLTAYFDESATENSSKPMTCVGGYMFDDSGLLDFENKWAEVLAPLRNKRIRYFHAAACNAGEDEFGNLRQPERMALFGDLIRLVRSTSKVGFVVSIEDAVLRSVSDRNRIQSYIGTKYTACALMVMQLVSQWAKDKGGEAKILYFYEDGAPSQKEADWMMNRIKATPELTNQYLYGGHEFVKKSAKLALQAADLLVWSFQQSWCKNEYSAYFKSLARDPVPVHHYSHSFSDQSLTMFGIFNMMHGIKSNLDYPEQTGTVRNYAV